MRSRSLKGISEMLFRHAGRVLLATVLAAAGQAALADGFQTPSGNIHCSADDWDGAAELRCDILSNAAVLPARPSDCDLDWGNAFVVSARAGHAIRACVGDTVADPNHPVLHYGSKWEQYGFVCSVDTDGVDCSNRHGNGFALSKKHQTLR